MNQIFINPLTNAIKHVNSGGKIIVEFEEALQPGDKGNVVLVYIVRDTGISAFSGFIRDIYQIFTRIVNSHIDKVHGSGLGLAITKQMVEFMDGTINCEGEPGKGTKFIVALLLPATRITNDLVLPPLHLLLVGNDKTSPNAAGSMLVSMGMTADMVDNGRTATEMAEVKHDTGEDYPITIVSPEMPGMNGTEVAGAIHAKAGENPPIVLISVYDWFEMEDAVKTVGISGFINKPIFKSTIYEKISEYLHFTEKSEKAAKNSSDELQGLHLLVAKDNDLNWEIIQELLKYRGTTATRTVNGQVCIDILKHAKPGTFDTVLMGIQMSVIGGYEASAAIRTLLDMYIRNIPIVAMTTDALVEDIRACLDAGMNDHIARPADMKKLFRGLRSAGLTNGNERKR